MWDILENLECKLSYFVFLVMKEYSSVCKTLLKWICEYVRFEKIFKKTRTRMHSSRMRTACSLIISHSICHARLPATHTHCHACPPATHAPLHACPPAAHASHRCTPPYHHAHPPAMHTPPVDRILNTRFWKYYLAPTSLRAVRRPPLSKSTWKVISYSPGSQPADRGTTGPLRSNTCSLQ